MPEAAFHAKRSWLIWPLLTCAMGGLLAYNWWSGRNVQQTPRNARVDLTSRKAFDQVRADFESLLQPAGFSIFEPAGVAGLAPEEVKRRLDALADKEGLMILAESDVGRRQSHLLGKTIRSKSYMIGNPLIAARMIALEPNASLYVPFRVLVFEDAQGTAHIAFDKPSQLLGSLGNDKVLEIARTLDQKLDELATRATSDAVAPALAKSGEYPMVATRYGVDHILVETAKPFAEVSAAFVNQLGKFDTGAYKDLAAGGDLQAAKSKLQAMVGPSGFMLFTTHNHGALLRLVGQKHQALQYIVGNPLFAIEMTQHDIRASLYAPLRVLMYEKDGKTCIEYDRALSLFGQFGNEEVNRMAASLDQKMEALVASSIR